MLLVISEKDLIVDANIFPKNSEIYFDKEDNVFILKGEDTENLYETVFGFDNIISLKTTYGGDKNQQINISKLRLREALVNFLLLITSDEIFVLELAYTAF